MTSIKKLGAMTREQAREYYISKVRDGIAKDGKIEVEFPDGVLYVDGIKNRMAFLTWMELNNIKQIWRESDNWHPVTSLFEILEWGEDGTQIIGIQSSTKKGA